MRDKVPMTKEEVRSVSLSRLRLTKAAVVYDVGAGTGSVSIEAALQAEDGLVYAIEKKPEAVELLRRNIGKIRGGERKDRGRPGAGSTSGTARRLPMSLWEVLPEI